MNTYLVPTTAAYFCGPYDHLYLVHANSQEEAYKKTIHDLEYEYMIQKPGNYEYYKTELNILPSYPFHKSKKDDILKEILQTISSEEFTMDIYDYMYWGNYNAQIQKLAEKALPEKWSFEGKDDNYILKNYLKYTFKKLQEENKILETDKYCIFDTGLFSHYYKPIYAYGEINLNATDKNAFQKWYFKGFKDEYELGKLDLETDFPERADYFSNPERLIFNWHNKIIINNKHILDDLNTNKRLPDSIKNSNTPLETLTGVINIAIQRVIANYKLAVPHYYQDKTQLLIPLFFDNKDVPDVALVLNPLKNGNYLATTCLSMEMAYMDARLIAKPDSNWLIAENIIGNTTDEDDFQDNLDLSTSNE